MIPTQLHNKFTILRDEWALKADRRPTVPPAEQSDIYYAYADRILIQQYGDAYKAWLDSNFEFDQKRQVYRKR